MAGPDSGLPAIAGLPFWCPATTIERESLLAGDLDAGAAHGRADTAARVAAILAVGAGVLAARLAAAAQALALVIELHARGEALAVVAVGHAVAAAHGRVDARAE